MERLITVFTPTFNRASVLHRCFDCLCNQTSFNFKWIIVDDGSTDNTRILCEKWMKRDIPFSIQYIYKENGGLHTAYNTIIPMLNTELFMCLESDDEFTSNAIETVEREWRLLKAESITGLVAPCMDRKGFVIGKQFPNGIERVKFFNHKKYAPGDKQYVFRCDLLKKVFPQIVFEGEKYFDPNYSFYELDRFGDMAVIRDCLCIAEYKDGGLTKTVFRQYMNSPNSFAELRKKTMTFSNIGILRRMVLNIHYVSSCCLAGNLSSAIPESPRKAYTIMAMLPGIILTQFIKLKNIDN